LWDELQNSNGSDTVQIYIWWEVIAGAMNDPNPVRNVGCVTSQLLHPVRRLNSHNMLCSGL
jgi:hypothetical protein